MEVPVGQVNLRSSLPCSASSVLDPMLHPVHIHDPLSGYVKLSLAMPRHPSDSQA